MLAKRHYFHYILFVISIIYKMYLNILKHNIKNCIYFIYYPIIFSHMGQTCPLGHPLSISTDGKRLNLNKLFGLPGSYICNECDTHNI